MLCSSRSVNLASGLAINNWKGALYTGHLSNTALGRLTYIQIVVNLDSVPNAKLVFAIHFLI